VSDVRNAHFQALFAALPQEIQQLARDTFRQFVANPAHPSLRHHQLMDTSKGSHTAGSCSVSITMKYRAIYRTDGNTRVWYWIGTHNDYENYIGKK
jgi:hypothetical protein